ncbi:MAG: prolipoprotein diacylglyceryl transferase [Devosia sp.]|uniref:prolipoprotein diacylglyceryl transferase n=1 Tax=Devosia sp. TaxID=1871048 RepID=UPI001A3BD195|nr:prolipoprotein diacylglyceryl transferase [Devosia sp.]MBL8599813.1 prolipoprotein diacylglyceryl transferase [Devosia sp.]
MPFPPLSPIALELGPLVIRWYALGYLAGVFGGAWYATTLLSREHLWANNRPPFPSKAIWDFAFWAIVGIVLGGRIGYVLFYNLPFYAANPGQIIALWDGGMSFHGGLVGIVAAMWLFVRRHNGSVLSALDLLGAIATIGICLVRITNFINAELYGAPTDLPWGIIFPTDPEQLPRHPTQLYEAGLEGLLLFLVVMLGTRRLGWLKRPGLTAGIFGIGYALGRSLVELWRLPDAQLGYLLGTNWLTMGMVLNLPVLAAGLALVAYAMARPRG